MRAPGDRRRIWVGLSIASLIWSGAVMGEAPAWRWRANGEAALKHNSNLTLTDGRDSEALSAALVELNGGAKGTGTVRGWRLDTQLSGLGNVHADHGEEDWFFARGRGGLRRAAGSGAVELSTEARYYTVPDQDTFDFLRNVAQAAYLLSLGEKWQARAGYANVLARYTQSPEFDYAVHGALFELRRRWSYDLNAYAQLDVQSYTGTSTPREVQGSPRDGQRYGVRLGLDGLFCGRHSLSVTYSFQSDEADLGVKQIGDPEIPENTQDIEAEFDLDKHRLTALYSVPLSERLLLSSYAEAIAKRFDDEIDVQDPFLGRSDNLLLWSAHVRYRLSPEYSLRLRYLLRANDSSVSGADYAGHLVSIGLRVER